MKENKIHIFENMITLITYCGGVVYALIHFFIDTKADTHTNRMIIAEIFSTVLYCLKNNVIMHYINLRDRVTSSNNNSFKIINCYLATESYSYFVFHECRHRWFRQTRLCR